jgi:hypothetical protein
VTLLAFLFGLLFSVEHGGATQVLRAAVPKLAKYTLEIVLCFEHLYNDG